MMKKIILKILDFYKKFISPIVHSFGWGGGCRFYPTCSDYSRQAIKKYGLFKGVIKSLLRIIKCNPLNKGGYDPC